MENMHPILLIFLLGIVHTIESNMLEYDGPSSIKLFHSLEESKEHSWMECGSVTFQNVNLGSFTVSSAPLDKESMLKLKNLGKKDLLYRLKAEVSTLKGRKLTFYTFTRACSLLESGLVDTLIISLDQSGSVIGVSMSASETCHNYADYTLDDGNFNRTIEFKPIELGPMPDTASYIQKMEREREAKERGATQDNRSFFAKYWMYIVPVVLFAVLSGSTNVDANSATSR